MEYKPSFLDETNIPIRIGSAWFGLEKILKPLIVDFKLNSDKALEIGVEWGYSLSALANVFSEVVGVDTFLGDEHSGVEGKERQYEKVLDTFKNHKNIKIIRSNYLDYFQNLRVDEKFDLIHIDIVHNYEDTYQCISLALKHTDCVILHDTESFLDVKKACEDISSKSGYSFYNYPFCHGLGILINEK